MFLRNHGIVILGETIEEAFSRAYHTVLACESQVRMMSVGIENLILVSDEAKRRTTVCIAIDSSHLIHLNPLEQLRDWLLIVAFVVWLFFTHLLHQEVIKKPNEFMNAGRNTVRLAGEGEQPLDEAKEKPRTREIKWRPGDLEFEAYMRMLDNSVCHFTIN